MIKFKNLTIKNFLSVGNATQSINFDRNDLTLVLGENLDMGGNGSRNGTGKTCGINALSYALYGQALTNIKKDNLINLTNAKGMLVSLEFSVNNHEYKIERGRKPNILRFFIDNKEQEIADDNSQGDSRQTQDAIEKLLGMSHDMFRHLVALNTYTEPFLAMRAADQRQIIEQLLGITALSEKAVLVKEQIKKTKEKHQQEEFRLNAIQEANKRVQEQIDSLKSRQVDWEKKKNDDLSKLALKIESLAHIDIDAEILAHQALEQYRLLKTEHATVSEKLKDFLAQKTKEEKIVARLKTEIQELEGNRCYACGQEFHDHKHSEVLAAKNSLLHTHVTGLADLESKITEANTKLTEIGELGDKPTVFYKTVTEVYNHKNAVEVLERDLINKADGTNPYTDQITEMEANALQEVSFENINTINKLLEHQEFLLKLLTNKDSFIRKKIIEQNLSYLNSRLSHYLDKLGLPHQVVFLNDLSVEITDLGRGLDFDNLSRGERGRLIVSLSFAFRDVWESLYSKVNLLFVDELLDNGFDLIGVESAMKLLKSMSRDSNKSVWLVSHRDEFLSRVENIMKVYKENGFTTYSSAE